METVSDVMNNTIDLSALQLGTISLGTLLSAMLTLVVCLVAIRVVMAIFKRILVRTSLDSRIQHYVSSAIRCLLLVVAILITAEELGIPTTSLVALLSVLSLAVSLAVQNVLSNIAGGLVILLTKPFQPGDYVETADGTGTVGEIHLAYTMLDTLDGLRISIPNSNLSAGKVINYTARGTRRIAHHITASYDAPIAAVREACLAAVAMTDRVLTTPPPAVYVNNYGESSIEYLVHCWATADDYWDVYFASLEHIKTVFDARGIEMTYNHLNVHILEQ